MKEQFVPTGEAPLVTLEVHGNLRLKGTDESEVRAETSSAENLSLDAQGDEVQVRCHGDCTVWVPFKASLKIQSGHGNASLKALEGTLEIENIHGNLDLRNVGSTRIKLVRGNLTAKHVSGDINLQTVDGNAIVRDVLGNFKVSDEIRGNLNLDEVEGDASAKAKGNLILRLDPLPGQTYDFSAGGNLQCRLPEDASSKVSISKAKNVIVNFPDVELPGKLRAPCDITLNDGDASLRLAGEGNVLISSWTPEWDMPDDFDETIAADFEGMAEDIAEQATQQIEAQMSMLERHLDEHLGHLSASLGAAGFTTEESERIARQAQEASERAAARAQEKMQRAQERIQRKIEAAQRRAEHKVRMAERHRQRRERGMHYEWSSSRQPPKGEPVSDDERLIILQMLEQKKISLIEAEQLLEALEGKEA